MVEGNDYDAMLEWTAPDLSAWEPPAVMPILPVIMKRLMIRLPTSIMIHLTILHLGKVETLMWMQL